MRTEFQMEKIIQKQKVLDRIKERQDWDNFWKNVEPAKLIELKKVDINVKKFSLLSFIISELKILKP